MDEQIQFSKETQKSYGRNWKKLIPVYIIVGLVLYGGVYYFLAKDKTKPNAPIVSAPTASQLSTSSSPTVMPKDNSANAVTDQENAKKQAQAFYKEWITSTGPGNGGVPDKSAYIDSLEKKGYITKNLVTQIKTDTTTSNSDRVSCSQNPLPFEIYKFSTPVVNDNTASMTVTGSYAGEPKSLVITLTLIKSNSQWSIDSIICPSVPTVAQ